MSKWDAYSRRELRRRRSAWVKVNARLIALVVVGIGAATAFSTWILTASGGLGPFRWYLVGAVHATVAVGTWHALSQAFLAVDGGAMRQLRGAWGEENTRGELRRARRRRLIWDWVDSVTFQTGDLDHLVVTRKNGLVAIDSKWRNDVNRDDIAAMAQSALTAQRRAEALARTVLTKERGSHRARTSSLSVTPVVVLWGGAQRDVPKDVVVDGVRFLAGRELVPWLRGLDGDAVAKDAAYDVVERLKGFRATAWQDA